MEHHKFLTYRGSRMASLLPRPATDRGSVDSLTDLLRT